MFLRNRALKKAEIGEQSISPKKFFSKNVAPEKPLRRETPPPSRPAESAQQVHLKEPPPKGKGALNPAILAEFNADIEEIRRSISQEEVEGIKTNLSKIFTIVTANAKSSPITADIKNWVETFNREPYLDDMKKNILTKKLQFWKEKIQG